jgi:hypothetical protein
MSNITIEWLSDEYADGANVFIDDVLVLELIPKANCFNDDTYTDTYTTETVYEKILEHLGHTIEYEAA